MEKEEDFVNCDCHGKSIPAIVCGHLVKNKGCAVGFVENSDDPEDLQAWCYACEYVYGIEKQLSEKFRAFNSMTVVCINCYREIKAFHEYAI